MILFFPAAGWPAALSSPVRGGPAVVHGCPGCAAGSRRLHDDDLVSRWRVRVSVAVVCIVVMCAVGGQPATGRPDDATDLSASGWIWPLDGFRVSRAYIAPAHAYGPGHRGIDLEPAGVPAVRAPAPGVVAFSGPVAGRGILTIDHGNGLVTTLEPVESDLRPGDAVARGDPVGTIDRGGHTAPGSVHFGVRLHGEYINPLVLLGGVPRAVLLPCCG